MEACASSHNENTEAYDMTNYQYSYASGPSLGTSNDDSIRPPLYYSPWSGPESVNMDANIVGLARGMDLPLSDPTTFPEPVAYSSLAPVNLVDYSILGDVFSRDNEEPILCRMTFEPPGNLWRAENSMPAFVGSDLNFHDKPVETESENRHGSRWNSTLKVPCRNLECEKTFGKKSDMIRHYDLKHKRSGYVCGDCEMEGKQPTLKRKDHFQTHLQDQHGREKKHWKDITFCQCTVCQGTNEKRAFSSRDTMERHIRQKHEGGSLAAYPERSDLSQHVFANSLPANASRNSDKQSDDNLAGRSINSYASTKRTQQHESPMIKRVRDENTVNSPQPTSSYHELGSSALTTIHVHRRALSDPISRNGQITNPRHISAIESSSLISNTSAINQTFDKENVEDVGIRSLQSPSWDSQNVESRPQSTDEIFVSSISAFDIIMLLVFSDSEYAMIEMFLPLVASEAGQPRKPFFSFNISQRLIKLYCPSNLIYARKISLEHDLWMIRSSSQHVALTDPWVNQRLDSKDLPCLGFQAQTGHHQSIKSSSKIFAMRNVEDSNLLALWTKSFLPSLFHILDEAIGSDYSASLVREGATEQLSTAVIRIESPTMPAQATKEDIRQSLDKVCGRRLADLNVYVRFLRGALVLLAGTDSAIPEHEQDSSTDDDRRELPFHTRWWKYPGMGASIGLLCTEEESATLGAYVEVNGETFILTIGHFVDESHRKLVAGIEDKLTLTSPALAKVKSMKRELGHLFGTLKGQLLAESKMEYGGRDVPFDEVRDKIPDNILLTWWKCRKIQTWLQELDKDNGEFKVGSLLHRSKPNSTAALCYSNSTVAFDLWTCPEERCHRLDWALFKVEGRLGTNRHRYRFNPDKGALDYSFEVEDYGSGDMVQETCIVEANAVVYFEGQTSRTEGEVNASLAAVSYGGRRTLEHQIIVNQNTTKKAVEYRGDSGAAVIRPSDNKLLGLIWGCVGVDPLFTPIRAIFKDIGESLNAVVRLAPDRGNPSPPTPVALPMTNEAILSSGNEAERPRLRPFRPSDVVSPELDEDARAKESALILQDLPKPPSLISIRDIMKAINPDFSAEDGPSSPVPSLSFSRSPSPKLGPGSPSQSPTKLPHVKVALDPPVAISEDVDAMAIQDHHPMEVKQTDRLLGDISTRENKLSFERMFCNRSKRFSWPTPKQPKLPWVLGIHSTNSLHPWDDC